MQSPVQVIEATTRSQLRRFVDFPNRLYQNVPQFVPATYGDDLSDWNPKQNPAFQYCEAKCFLAYRNGEIVGRIGAILSHKANQKFNRSRVRFTQVDFIDDYEVSKALFDTVENWCIENGCNEVAGPMGFTDLDREGMLVEGFENESLFFTYYNFPYYIDHLTRLGYVKEVDWIEYLITTPERGSRIDQYLKKISEYVAKKEKLHLADVHSKREFKPLVEKVFRLINAAYAPLFGVVELNEDQIKRYAAKFIPMINPKYTAFVLDESDELVAFGVAAPSLSEALKKSRGRLFPLGWIGLLKALHKNDKLNLFLVAVRPEKQCRGINSMMIYKILQNAIDDGIYLTETGPMLEHNTHILAQWKPFDKIQHKRRRCFVKSLKPEMASQEHITAPQISGAAK
jgi:GNAT superfamily N-acetyltransferase